MNFRKLIFWTHLVVGVVAGLVILVMAVTGVLIAYQRQIVTAAEKQIANVVVPSPAAVLSLQEIGEKLRIAYPKENVTGFTRRTEPDASLLVNFGETARFVNPYTGEVTGDASFWRGFLHEVEHFHRDLALGPTGKGITGAAALAFLGLLISGLFLWLPRKWTKVGLKAVTVPSVTLRGRARQWNWHNSFGFWAAIPLLLMIITGLIMSYQWANNLLFRLSGSEVPPPRAARAQRADTGERLAATNKLVKLDPLWAKAVEKIPNWKSGTLRLGDGGEGPVTFMMDQGDGTQPHLRSQVVLNRRDGEVQRVESFETYNLGRKLRMWTKFVHTGEAGGIIGQTIAALGALAGALLVWTGFALAMHRFRNRGKRVKTELQANPSVPQPAAQQLVP